MRWIGLFALALTGCEAEYNLVPVSTADDSSSAVRAWEDSVSGVRVEEFAFGSQQQTPIADYLFIVDNSSSMATVIDRVRRGFETLAKENPFPAKSRIAVMGTLPSKELSPKRPHRAVRSSSMLSQDPGFMNLIDKKRIAKYRRVMPEIANRFALDGCDEGWFKPGDTNSAGIPCIVAHTQTGMRDVRVEAGLTVLKQMLLKEGAEPLFRAGAAANVIYVSDTHDPGANPRKQDVMELVQYRPDYSELKALVDKNSTVSSFRIHAVAPRTNCSENWSQIGPVYFDAVDASGGKGIDVCTAEDYSTLIKEIAETGSIPTRAVFPLGKPAVEVEFVQINDIDVPFKVSDRGDLILLDREIPTDPESVKVHYTMEAVRELPGKSGGRKVRPKKQRVPTPNKVNVPGGVR